MVSETKATSNKMRKKAAILTWCNNNGPSNYGQILQCYSMQKIVESWGYEAFIVLYQRTGAVVPECSRRGKKFREFIEKNICCSVPCHTKAEVESVTKDAELLICGSDQIWNPACFDPVYFLDFGRKDQRRIAYAVSGIFEDREEYRGIYQRMADLIKGFEKVALREKTGAAILQKYTEKHIGTAPDPTLHLNSCGWDEVAAGRLEEQDYIFCYMLGNVRPFQLIVREIQKAYQAEKILFIPSNTVVERVETLPGFSRVDAAGPAEFISLVKYAKAVCTDSFHGAAMSMIYDIPFFATPRIQTGSQEYFSMIRILDLLKERKMEKRLVRNVKDVRNCI